MRIERHHLAWILASVITVASFLGATVYTEVRLARVDDMATTLEVNAVPSIEFLGRTAVHLTKLSEMMDDLAGEPGRRASEHPDAEAEITAARDDFARYKGLVPLRGEGTLWSAAGRAVERALTAVSDVLNGEASPDQDEYLAAGEALDAATAAVLATLEFDTREAERLARDVQQIRSVTVRMISVLDALATLVAFLAVILAYRASRSHDVLRDAHASLLRARVAELDRFAGRVAHDILNPLGVIAGSLGGLEHATDSRTSGQVARARRALERVQQLVEGLLMFARSGARPDPAARCALDQILPGLTSDLSEAASAKRVALDVEMAAGLVVRCSPGVVTSIVENLVRNAIKYIGDGPQRRILVRVHGAGAALRLEVEDTGPGISPELQAAVFEPFVRGTHDGVAGSGLGLATVKRLVESHGGRTGLRSAPGRGSTFWVELPLAEAAVPAEREHGSAVV